MKQVLSGPFLGLLFVLTFAAVVLAANDQLGNFLTGRNAQNLLHASAVTAVASLGMLLIIVSGGIDLSVGAVVALVTVVTMRVYNHCDARGLGLLTSLAAVAAGLAVGGLCGLTNGLIVTFLTSRRFWPRWA